MVTASVISVGDELLRGRVVDTNFAWLAKKLFVIGVDVIHHSTVPDVEEWVCAALGDATQRCCVIFTTGGLGPTPDDATRKGLCRFLGREMVFDQRIAKKIHSFFTRRGIDMPESNLVQAYIPKGGTPIDNPEGTAPGIFVRTDDGKLVFMLPGPPTEMKAVFRTACLILRRELHILPPACKLFRTIGVPETVLEKWISQMTLPDGVKVSYYPSLRGVDIFIRSDDEKKLASAANDVSKRTGDYIFAEDNEDVGIEQVLGDILRSRGETLATAESCTGGMLSSRIVDIPGSSDYFVGGVVSYSNEIKERLLGVRKRDIEEHGAVSRQVARQMAFGAREKLRATYGIGITGIAGPAGGTKEKPVGLVYVALATPDDVLIRRYHLVGGRNAIRTRSATAALNILWVKLIHDDVRNYPFQDGGEWV